MSEPGESWTALERAWREGSGEAESSTEREMLHARLLRRVKRQSLLMSAGVALELLVALALVALIVPLLRDEPGAFEVVTAAAVVSFLALASAFSIRNRRGVWRAHAATTRHFLELSLERCRRRQEACRFAVGLILAEGLFFLFWIPWAVGRRAGSLQDYVAAYAFLAAMVAAWLAVTGGLWSRTRRQQAQLERLRAALEV